MPCLIRRIEKRKERMETRKRLEDKIIKVMLCRLKDQHETDREKYRDVLDERYYFGYLDGQKRMIKLIEQIMSQEG
ncbi:MAG: hypothetical protein A4E57_01240 [Syntrophorhabdaceae bacterium PtaU1.Bin034]|jgi:hypothetical protein|nr:MAG: hypothetical protein A4E57_01240 [Syntrophorhabdaceae bacterium PtaU1.Bin034]